MMSLYQQAERISRPLWSFRRNLNSLERAFYEKVITPQLQTVPPPSEPEIGIEVICLVGSASWEMAIWTARSLEYFSERRWRHVWIDDGSLTQEIIDAASVALSGLRIVRRSQGDEILAEVLARYPACQIAASDHPIFRRAFLLSAVMRGDRAVSIDSDVLFFANPKEMLAWAGASEAKARFMYDPITFYFPKREVLSQWLGKPVLDHVNGGLVLLPAKWHDLEMTEHFLRAFWNKAGRSWHIEQSILALQMSRLGGVPLTEEHEVSFHPQRRQFCVARHYVGAGPVRDYFYTEGVALLSRFLLPGRALQSNVGIN